MNTIAKIFIGGMLLYLAGIILMTHFALLSFTPAVIGWAFLWSIK